MKETEYATRTRVVRVLRTVMEAPYRYTIKALAEKYGVSKDTIRGDIHMIEYAGFQPVRDERHRYALTEDKPYKQLKSLLHFSSEDQELLYRAIDQIPGGTERHQKLKLKLASIYDFRRLGLMYLRKPYLTKVDMLEQGRQEKKQVILKDYHSSNSSTVEDRLVEAFHISPSEDMIHAYDLNRKAIRHFRISRFVRVELTEHLWQHEGAHNIIHTDPFRIVNNELVMVHLRLSVGAYNELIERYPLSRNHIEPGETANTFDFQCNINANFYGLSNFILGFYHLGIEIVSPDILADHLRGEVAKMKF